MGSDDVDRAGNYQESYISWAHNRNAIEKLTHRAAITTANGTNLIPNDFYPANQPERADVIIHLAAHHLQRMICTKFYQSDDNSWNLLILH